MRINKLIVKPVVLEGCYFFPSTDILLGITRKAAVMVRLVHKGF